MDCFATLAMTDHTGTFGLELLRLAARGHAGEDEIDHLVDGRARLVDALGDHLRMEVPDHAGAAAQRRLLEVGHLEFARRHQVKQAKADKVAVTIFANILKKGIEIKSPQQARALAGFFDAVD